MAHDPTITVVSTSDSLRLQFPTTFGRDRLFKNGAVLGRLLRLLVMVAWLALMAWAARGFAQDIPANYAHFAALGWRGSWLYVWVGGGLGTIMTFGAVFVFWGLLSKLTGARTQVRANRSVITSTERHGPVRWRRVCRWRDVTGLSLTTQYADSRTSAAGRLPLFALVTALLIGIAW